MKRHLLYIFFNAQFLLLSACYVTADTQPSSTAHENGQEVDIVNGCVSTGPTLSQEYNDCAANSLSRHDDTQCQNAELERLETQLAATYQSTQERIQDFRHEDLKSAQALWIQYRDAHCGLFYHRESGSGGQNDALYCYMQKAQQRISELNEFY